MTRANLRCSEPGHHVRLQSMPLAGPVAELGSLGRYARISAPKPNDPKRDCSLPPGCKDLIDAIREQPEPVPISISLPPITRHVTLPEEVSVQYLSELLGHDIAALSGYTTPRTIPFDDAQRILRRYGIEANKAA